MIRNHLTNSVAFAVLALAATPGYVRDRTQGVSADSVVAFRDVTVIPMIGPRSLEHQTVLIRGDRIVAVGAAAAVSIPPDATVIDGAGKYLMPGLADMRVRLPFDSTGLAARNTLTLLIANGVTTVRMWGGQARHLAMRDSISRGEVLGPSMYVVGSAVGAVPGNTDDMRRVLGPAETARFAERMKLAGYDFIQVNTSALRQEYEALAGAARRVGIPLTGAVPTDAGLERVIKARQASIENLDGYLPTLERDNSPVRLADPFTRARQLVRFYDPEKIAPLGASLREANVANTPTLFINHVTFTEHTAEEMAAWPEMRYVAPAVLQDWSRRKRRATDQQTDPKYGPQYLEYRNQLVKGLADTGAPILVGSDALGAFLVPGFSTLYEIHSLTVAGLTVAQALEAATRNAARFLGAESEFGAVAPGMRADLLLLNANPLTHVGNLTEPAGVMLRGRWIPSEEIQRMLTDVAQSYNR